MFLNAGRWLLVAGGWRLVVLGELTGRPGAAQSDPLHNLDLGCRYRAKKRKNNVWMFWNFWNFWNVWNCWNFWNVWNVCFSLIVLDLFETFMFWNLGIFYVFEFLEFLEFHKVERRCGQHRKQRS